MTAFEALIYASLLVMFALLIVWLLVRLDNRVTALEKGKGKEHESTQPLSTAELVDS